MNSYPPSIDDLLDALRQMDVEIRFERLGGKGGGLCRVGKQAVFFVDQDADPATTTEASLDALLFVPGIERMFLKPSVREALATRNGA